MWMNKLYIWQSKGAFYIYTPQNELKAIIALPQNGQNVFHMKALDGITKILARVWGVIQPNVK